MLACPKIALPDLEAISSILDANLTKLVEVEQMQPVSHLAVPLLQLMLSHPATEPLVISELLSCTSALFACVLVQPSALQPILQKMFAPLAVPNTDNSKCVHVFFILIQLVLILRMKHFPTGRCEHCEGIAVLSL